MKEHGIDVRSEDESPGTARESPMSKKAAD